MAPPHYRPSPVFLGKMRGRCTGRYLPRNFHTARSVGVHRPRIRCSHCLYRRRVRVLVLRRHMRTIRFRLRMFGTRSRYPGRSDFGRVSFVPAWTVYIRSRRFWVSRPGPLGCHPAHRRLGTGIQGSSYRVQPRTVLRRMSRQPHPGYLGYRIWNSLVWDTSFRISIIAM